MSDLTERAIPKFTDPEIDAIALGLGGLQDGDAAIDVSFGEFRERGAAFVPNVEVPTFDGIANPFLQYHFRHLAVCADGLAHTLAADSKSVQVSPRL
ncbi:MAG: hypothetical protein WB630_00570 [Candidatus Acidiferrales bacterium]